MVRLQQRPHVLSLLFGLLLAVSLSDVAQGAIPAKSAKQNRLRGISSVPQQRKLDSMFANTGTQHHIQEQYRHSAMEVVDDDPRGPERTGTTAIAVEASEEIQHNGEAEAEKTADDFQPVAPRKEKPSGLYHTTRAKTSKPKTSANKTKDKASKSAKDSPPSSSSADGENFEQTNIEEFSEDEEPPAPPAPKEEEPSMEDETMEESSMEEEPMEDPSVEEESEEFPSMEKDSTEEESTEEDSEEEPSMEENTTPEDSEDTDDNVASGDDTDTEGAVDTEASSEDDVEETVDMDTMTEEAPSGDVPAASQDGKAAKGAKGKGKGRNRSVPQMTEIKVGFEYRIKSETAPTNAEYAELAKATAHMFDSQFRNYFMDIEEVEFLSTDRLPIYDVRAPTYVEFTIASYFDGDFSLPSESQLNDISSANMRSSSPNYDYYLYLLQNLDPANPFQSVIGVSFYSQTSLLSAPENLPSQGGSGGNSNGMFKVIIPIVLLLTVSVIAAMVYMSWVEYHTLPEEKEELKLPAQHVPKKKEKHPDGTHTPPSETDGSFSDDGTSLSETSARFIGDTTENIQSIQKKVRVSPRVLYRTFTPGELATRADFEEVSLHDIDNAEMERPVSRKDIQPKVTINQAMDDFQRVLNSAKPDEAPQARAQADVAPFSELFVPHRSKSSHHKRTEEDIGDTESCSSVELPAPISELSIAPIELPEQTAALLAKTEEAEKDCVTRGIIVDEFEEEVLSVETEYEEELVEDEEIKSEEARNGNVPASEEPKTTETIEPSTVHATSEVPKSIESSSVKNKEIETSEPSLKQEIPLVPPSPRLSGGNLRNFWEKKSAQEEVKEVNLKEFWEKQSQKKH